MVFVRASLVRDRPLESTHAANMVAGSGPDPGTDKTKRLYDGKLDSWPAAKIKIKSYLFKLGLWNVVQDGPSDHAETPVHAHAGPLPTPRRARGRLLLLS